MMKTLKAVVKKSPLFKVYVEAKRLFMPTSPPGLYNSIVKQINSYCGGLDGKSILELGCSIEGDFIGDVARCHRVREAVGINIFLSEIRQLSPILRLQPGDIRKMDFDDDHYCFASRVDALAQIGTAHIMCCLALMQAWQDKARDCVEYVTF